ncbi:hypothetical protein BJP36_04255 [Moorena producens JHB]|uniref:Uncharacterized protein n=1 Tax=Moorena producens (strain JHB) TaxID=1454205 RepID=A0A1D9FV97_MOOP1|nr:hypothetical protein [Moorena producens]AOY79245.1 hypothetical protein BJP36_04255 [Moorena producens JHB]
MKRKHLFQKIAWLAVVSSLSTILLAQKAQAQPLCREVSSNPPIGTVCIDIQKIHARGDNSTDSFRSTYPDSWVIKQVEPRVFTRYGNTDGPHIRYYESGTRLKSYEAWKRAVQELENLRARAEGTDPNTGQSRAYEYINQQLSEFRNNLSAVASVSTNRAQVEAHVSASRRCTARTPVGCLDWQGGSFGVDLYIYREYVGTPQLASSQLSTVRERALSLIREAERAEQQQESIYKRVTVNASTSEWHSGFSLPGNTRYRIVPSTESRYTLNGGKSYDRYYGSGVTDGEPLGIPSKRISLGALNVLIWHHRPDGNHVPQIISFFKGMTSEVVSIGSHGGSMHFIIGDIAGTYGDNFGKSEVSVYSLDR